MQIETNEKEYSAFQYFIFVFLIPILFTVTIAAIILHVAGVNVSKEARKIASHIPIIESYVKSVSPLSEDEKIKNNLAKLIETNKKAEEELKTLKSQSKEKDQHINSLRIEAEKLRQQIKDLEERNTASIDSEEEKKALSKKLFTSYEEMSEKQAAQILQSVTDDEAFYILSNLKNEAVTEILANMDVKKAAKFTSMMTASSR
ncbi:magnesium transporter MgtE N-terminal domain-containing protein [Gottfriedia sp. OAE603]|uniref:MotE family protein n=1 Tax=Gottfriedia sp. OAE603 TaxID=2663872 RepID=UPI001789ADD2